MKRKTYKVSGNPKVGHRVAVPAIMGWENGDAVECEIKGEMLVYRRKER